MAGRRTPPGELDAGGLPDQTASSAAPDEVFRPQRPAVGQLDVDAGVVLRETGHLTAVVDRHRQSASHPSATAATVSNCAATNSAARRLADRHQRRADT